MVLLRSHHAERRWWHGVLAKPAGDHFMAKQGHGIVPWRFRLTLAEDVKCLSFLC